MTSRRILVLGHSGSGKTSLIRSVLSVSSDYRPQNNWCPCNMLSDEGTPMIWMIREGNENLIDNEEIYKSAVEQADIIVITWDNKFWDSFETAVNTIDSLRYANSKLILVATKCDIDEPDLLGRRTICDAEYMETSAMMDIGIDCLRDVLIHTETSDQELTIKKPKKHWTPKFPIRFPKLLKKAKSLDSHTASPRRPTTLIPRSQTLSLPDKTNEPAMKLQRAVSYSFEKHSPAMSLRSWSPWATMIPEQYGSSASIDSNSTTMSTTSKIETAFQRLGRQCPTVPTPTFSDYKPSFFESIQEGLQGAVRVSQSSMKQVFSQTAESVKFKVYTP